MVRIGSFEIRTEILLLVSFALLLAVQLLFCFKAKRLWIRLIPLGMFAAVAAVLVFISLFDENRRILLLIYALYLGVMAFICACGWAIWWIVDSLVAYIRKSNKKQIITLLSVIASAVLIVVTAVSLFKYNYPTYYPYKDREIIGSTPEEIKEKYGEFGAQSTDDSGTVTFAKYMIRENTPDLIMSKDDSLWYHIYFKDGVAVRVKLQEGHPGG